MSDLPNWAYALTTAVMTAVSLAMVGLAIYAIKMTRK